MEERTTKFYEAYSEAMGLICKHCNKNEACSDGEVKECKIAEHVRKFFIEGEDKGGAE